VLPIFAIVQWLHDQTRNNEGMKDIRRLNSNVRAKNINNFGLLKKCFFGEKEKDI